jgi:hypothetical protein
MRNFWKITAVVLALGIVGCSDDDDGASPVPNPPNVEEGLSSVEAEALDEAIQDAYQAQATYHTAMATMGNIAPLNQLALAENNQINLLKAIYRTREMEPPVSESNPNNVPTFETLNEVCAEMQEAEANSLQMYTRLLRAQLAEDIRVTFERIQAATEDHHIPTLRTCANQPTPTPRPPAPTPTAAPTPTPTPTATPTPVL